MANIIKQLKDSDGNNIYPIAYAQGGVKMDLLWTNPNPTSSFTEQTISLDLSEYSALVISIKGHKSVSGTQEYNTVVIKNDWVFLTAFSGASYYPRIVIREVSFNDSGVTFKEGYNTSSFNSYSRDNDSGIPQKIYGIKMSYIVPTTVNGLQYVEV